MILLAVMLVWGSFGTGAYAVTAEESDQSEKHLVIKIVEDEELLEIDDYDVPLAAFSEETQDQRTGIRHIILMSAMLACVTVFVLYQSVNEKKLIALRRKAALAQHRVMTENRKL